VHNQILTGLGGDKSLSKFKQIHTDEFEADLTINPLIDGVINESPSLNKLQLLKTFVLKKVQR
jgi:hypothetical protein